MLWFLKPPSYIVTGGAFYASGPTGISYISCCPNVITTFSDGGASTH